jgi:LacI family transcriptional regulator
MHFCQTTRLITKSGTLTDNYEFLDFLEPRLTVVDHALEDMGRGDAELLIDLIDNGAAAPVSRLYQPELKIYDSCKSL